MSHSRFVTRLSRLHHVYDSAPCVPSFLCICIYREGWPKTSCFISTSSKCKNKNSIPNARYSAQAGTTPLWVVPGLSAIFPRPRAAARGISRRAAHHAPHQNKARPDETQGRRPRTADTRAGTAPLSGAARRTERAPHRRTPDKNKAARAELRGGGASFDKPVGGTRPATFLMIGWRPAYSSGYQSPAYISLTYSTHACSTSSAVIVQPSGIHP